MLVWGVLGPGSIPNRHGAGIRGHSRARCGQIQESDQILGQSVQIVLYSALRSDSYPTEASREVIWSKTAGNHRGCEQILEETGALSEALFEKTCNFIQFDRDK